MGFASRRKSIALFGVLALALALLPGTARAGINPHDALFLSDSAQPDDGVSYLFSVHIDPVTNHAVLHPMPNGAIPFNQMDAIACTPDGARVYGFDKLSATGTGKLGYYRVFDGTWHEVGYVTLNGNPVQGIVLAAFSPNGTLYAASEVTDTVMTVNPTTAEATAIGQVVRNGTVVHALGADLAFTALGTPYLWTNTANGPNAPSGLYTLSIPNSPGPIAATFIGTVGGDFFTGIAIRANGWGDLAGSTHGDEIHTQSLADAQDTPGSPHPMYLNGVPYDYEYGDMSNGQLQACTRTIGYYKNHDWDGGAVTICGKAITEDGVGGTIDGQNFLRFGHPTSTDFSMLFAQLIAAKLNTGNASGVSLIDDAEAWLCEQGVVLPSGLLDFHKSFDSNQQKTTATTYSNALDQFNNSAEDTCVCLGSNNRRRRGGHWH